MAQVAAAEHLIVILIRNKSILSTLTICIIRFEDKHLFGQTYLSIISFVSIIISVLVNLIYFVLLDRFIMGAVQRRSGPYIVG